MKLPDAPDTRDFKPHVEPAYTVKSFDELLRKIKEENKHLFDAEEPILDHRGYMVMVGPYTLREYLDRKVADSNAD